MHQLDALKHAFCWAVGWRDTPEIIWHIEPQYKRWTVVITDSPQGYNTALNHRLSIVRSETYDNVEIANIIANNHKSVWTNDARTDSVSPQSGVCFGRTAAGTYAKSHSPSGKHYGLNIFIAVLATVRMTKK